MSRYAGRDVNTNNCSTQIIFRRLISYKCPDQYIHTTLTYFLSVTSSVFLHNDFLVLHQYVLPCGLFAPSIHLRTSPKARKHRCFNLQTHVSISPHPAPHYVLEASPDSHHLLYISIISTFPRTQNADSQLSILNTMPSGYVKAWDSRSSLPRDLYSRVRSLLASRVSVGELCLWKRVAREVYIRAAF